MWKNNYRDVLRAIHRNDLPLTKELLKAGCSSHIDIDEIVDLLTFKLKISDSYYMVLQPLELAIDNCNLKIVQLLLQRGASAGAPSSTMTYLQRAAFSGNHQIIVELLKYNFDWKVLDDETGDSLMHLVLKRKDDDWRENLKIVTIESMQCFKNIKEKNIVKVLKMFLDLGMDVNMTNIAGETCLNLAVKKRMTTVSDFLIDRGAQVDKIIQLNDSFVYSLIEDEMNLNRKGNSRTIHKKLLRFENAVFVKWCLSKVGGIDYENNLDKSLFQKVITYDWRHFLPRLVKYLKNINYTYDVQLLHRILFKPLKLHWHRIKDCYVSFEYIKDLIDKGIDMNAADKYGNTLLHVIAGCYDRYELKKCFQRVTFPNWEEKQVEEQLADFTFNIESLLQFLELKSEKSNIPTGREMVNLLLSRGCKVDATSWRGKTALYLAVDQNTHWLVEHLLKNGADVNQRHSMSGISLLELAATIRFSGRTIEKLIMGGARVHEMDKTGRSILHDAIFFSNMDGLKVLLQMGADVDGLARSGRTALQLAFELPNADAMVILLEFGANIKNLHECSKVHDNSPEIGMITSQYVAMQNAAGLPVSDENYCFCRMLETYEQCYAKCLIEIEVMKKTFIEDNEDTLYDFFHMDPDRKLYFAASNDFEKFKKEFPNCSTLISAHYWMAFERKTMLKHVLGWFKTLTVVLPELCVERIIKDFENWQLKLLVEDAYKD